MKLSTEVKFGVTLILLVQFIGFITIDRKVEKIEVKVNKIANVVAIDDTTYKETYNEILPKIKQYNEDVNPNTVQTMAKVMHHYGLDKTDNSTKMFMGQILQESGGSQYYVSGHPLEGKLIVSSGGAIGISQILPSTALGYMSKIVTKKDKIEMARLGCTDFAFAKNNTGDVSKMDRARAWLKNEKNNIILWGYIMHDLFKRSKNIEKSLVSYNAGIGGMQMFLDSGNVLSNHEYIINIKSKLASVSGL